MMNEIRMGIRNIQRYPKKKLWLVATLMLLVTVLVPAWFSLAARAAVQNPVPSAKISFTFDDGLTSALTRAQPTLAKYGLTGTDYVITRCVGMSAIPNTCHANTDASYMTWTQIKQLKAAGWEIGSHTATHPYLASSDASDGQPNVLTPAQVSQELSQSKADFTAQGIDVKAFSTPYGDYTAATLAQIAKVYTSHRGFADQGNNIWPYNDYLLNNMQVQSGVTVAQVKAKIDAAITNKYWLVLTMHDIKPTPSNDPDDYEYGTTALDQIAAYVKTKQNAGLITPVNISNGLVASDTNLLPNNSFESGISGGWTTDVPSSIAANAATNGSAPNPAGSVALNAAAQNGHLFSPIIAVDSNTTYLLKQFVNVTRITGGEVGFFIDEYDGFNNWISGQYKNGERSAFVENFNFSYKPTSANVKKARLQVIVTANSGITGFYDTAQWFALSSVAPPPVPTNLVANGTFDSGISGGWTTNSPTTITADTTNHGSPSNPVNSVKLVATTVNRHLFSPKVAVDPLRTYNLLSYVAVAQLSSGEVGFYVDEYDAAGNWVSGQYKTGVRGVSSGDVSISYKPSSSAVKSASLQIIVTGNSNITAYYDDARWYLTN
ncbi:MAG TPA: polysaccharide deacetylase family protein [Candidatus Saccharimonadales bacterium]